MTPLENGGNKPKSRGVKMTPLDDDGQARGVTSDTSRGGASDTPIERTNTKQITLLPPTEASPRDGESRDGEEQTDTIIDASDGTGATDATTGDGTERWQDAEPEPEPATGIDARTRAERLVECFASMFVRQVRQCFSAVWADGFPRCRHRFPVM